MPTPRSLPTTHHKVSAHSSSSLTTSPWASSMCLLLCPCLHKTDSLAFQKGV